jgi:3-dehydroquinate dehydratase-1
MWMNRECLRLFSSDYLTWRRVSFERPDFSDNRPMYHGLPSLPQTTRSNSISFQPSQHTSGWPDLGLPDAGLPGFSPSGVAGSPGAFLAESSFAGAPTPPAHHQPQPQYATFPFEASVGTTALTPDEQSQSGSAAGGATTDTSEKDPFLSLLEQLAENEHSQGGPSELDFFLGERLDEGQTEAV